MNCNIFRNLGTYSTPTCDAGWTTAHIATLNSSYIGYHNHANTSRTWCLKDAGESTGGTNPCTKHGANRIAFGTGRESFAAAILEVLNTNLSKFTCICYCSGLLVNKILLMKFGVMHKFFKSCNYRCYVGCR